MIWPFSRIRELELEARGYSDTLTELLVARAAGGDAPTGSAHLTAAVEACAGAYARAFASCTMEPDVPALTPALLASIARSLVVSGESLHLLQVNRGVVRLIPSGSWDVLGKDPDEGGWRYKVQICGPDGSVTREAPSTSVLHCRYSVDPSRPWQGVGPLTRAGLSADLLSSIETRLSQEAAAKSAYVVPSPTDGQAGTTSTLRSDIANAKGGVVLAETLKGGYGDPAAAPAADWSQKRIGADPPDILATLRTDAAMAIMAALGVPSSLIAAPNVDGTAQREAWRRFVHGSVRPLARLIATEIEVKLEERVSFDFSDLYASDVVGRAGAFARMVQGGMAVQEAAALSGLLVED